MIARFGAFAQPPATPAPEASRRASAGAGAPRLSGVDETTLTAWSRFGDRLRLTSTAEIAGYDRTLDTAQLGRMRQTAEELFPGAADYDRASNWAGLRPQTPEGTPILGRGRLVNLHYNTGHGHMGWTMACGSARIIADLVAGRSPGIDITGMTLNN